jgi:hypothetical protein
MYFIALLAFFFDPLCTMEPVMRRRWFTLMMVLAAALLAVIDARACEPCQSIATFDEAADAAQLIIVGQVVAEGPSTGSGPDWITVQVIDVLKGDPPDTRIRVNSWDGMCGYGVVLAKGEQAVMLLTDGGEQFITVNYGCAISQYAMTDGAVVVDNQPVGLTDFATMLGPNAHIEHISDAGSASVLPVWIFVLGAGALTLVVLAGIGGVWWLRRSKA